MSLRNNGTNHPAISLLNLALPGPFITQALGFAARVRLLDCLERGHKTPRSIAELLKFDSNSMERLFLFLESLGILERDNFGEYSATTVGAYLRSDIPGSMRSLIEMWYADHHWELVSSLPQALQSGMSAYHLRHGTNQFQFLDRDADLRALFDESMSCFSYIENASILSLYDFSQYKTVVDIGGGEGSLLREICTSYENVNGVLFDLPEPIQAAKQKYANQFDELRIKCLAGDMFDAIPSDADLYILKSVLIDWSDERANALLVNVAHAMNSQATLLICESTAAIANMQPFYWAVEMEMILVGGRKRSTADLHALLGAAGLETVDTVTSEDGPAIISCRRRNPAPSA